MFGRGFTFTRSFTYPYLFERVGPLWVMRDAPRTKPEYRVEEWLVFGVGARAAEKVIQENRRERFSVCAFRTLEQSEAELKCDYKALGYRVRTTELFFAHDLKEIPECECDYSIKRVTDLAGAHSLKAASGRTQIRPEDLSEDPPRLRQYVALDEQKPIGWVRSVDTGGAGWCSNMYVEAAYRRRGIAKALMTAMLRGDREAGFRSAVLAASLSGAMLYPTVGYRPVGQLIGMNAPRK